ncbi:MAG TPA: SpoIIE family protein phosphatase [Terracidiphilus sp.]|nr:SpoIIE family protein phosphatase [Terracidiphilus sp.]
MSGFAKRLPSLVCLVFLAVGSLPMLAAESSSTPVLTIHELGKGVAKLDGPWQFHLGDNPAWAQPDAGDDQSNVGWEQLSPDKTWGEQGHPAYTGYAWYRRHIHIMPAEGASPDFALYISRIDDVYELYWNGVLVGSHGTMPPNTSFPYRPPPQTFGLGPIRDGVLAIRVWKAPLMSFDSDKLGGLDAAPVIGSPTAIAGLKAESDYNWLRSRQYYFGTEALYLLVMVLSFLAWIRDRKQRVLMWMATFSGASVLVLILVGLRIPFTIEFALGWLQPVLSLIDISIWFLLLYLLKLDENPTLYRFTRILAIFSICATSLDGLVTLDWSNPTVTHWAQILDAVLTTFFTVAEAYPLVLVALAVRKRLDHARWLVAITAFLAEMISVVRIALQQGSRFTHWTIGDKIGEPLFIINGNVFTAQTIASTLMLLAIIYGVYRYLQEAGVRQGALEQEMKSARELQQVLIPESLPPLPGFAFTSSYRPAAEVGGDFFQVIPLEGESAGSTLILLGDVSGKGLRAAMTVSLIVGAARTLAKFAPQPAAILSELNQRLFGRLQGGFVTCLALRLSPSGECVMASAGHPAPFLNKREVSLPGAIPLGVVSAANYEETSLTLHEGDHFALYTDGLLEARKPGGEIFSFERLNALFATRPDAAKATEAAINFGQDDDITVLTLTRLATGQQSTTTISIPKFANS